MKDYKFAFLAGAIFFALGIFAHVAHAADLGLKDSTPARTIANCDCADTINWAGLSIGIEVGIIDVQHGVDVSEAGEGGSINLFKLSSLGGTGFFGKLSAQYDIQPRNGDWIIGARGWYGLSNADSSASILEGILSAKLERGDDYGGVLRLGRLLGSEKRTAIVLEGGYQWAKYDLSASSNGQAIDISPVLETSKTYQGFVAGIRAEHAFSQNIFGDIGYHHWFAGDEEWSKINGLSVKIGAPEDIFDMGLRYKF